MKRVKVSFVVLTGSSPCVLAFSFFFFFFEKIDDGGGFLFQICRGM